MLTALNIESDCAEREAELKGGGISPDLIRIVRVAYFNGVLSAIEDIADLPGSTAHARRFEEMLEICKNALNLA